MQEELSIQFFINNSVAIGVAWYVLTRLNSTLKDLTIAIDKLGCDVVKRLEILEKETTELKRQVSFKE